MKQRTCIGLLADVAQFIDDADAPEGYQPATRQVGGLMNIQTILWPTDLSKNSLKAGKHVLSLAQKYNAQIILMYVAVDLCSYFPAYGNYPNIDHLNNFRDWELEKARKRLEEICDTELKGCPYLRLRLVQGDPTEQILELAHKEKADLIVLTNRGQGKGAPITDEMGNVASKVIKKSSIPVYVIPFVDAKS
jgi:nucleotide-binding universal stress UspA family protein